MLKKIKEFLCKHQYQYVENAYHKEVKGRALVYQCQKCKTKKLEEI